mmetsp:Transcript_102174/g.181458  ORF Transcript_102174/g.181458 Transcript_102174/m.181458 type:complete len:368 (-) Transcript_102174:92-1195(-)
MADMLKTVATPLRRRESNTEVTPAKRTAEGYAIAEPYAKLAKTGAASSMRGRSLVAIARLSLDEVAEILRTAGQMHELVKSSGGDDSLKGKVLASVFYEPSTRTNCSFQAAMLRLGGQVISVNESSSSVAKGETLSDTVRCLECYCDVLVLRHPKAGAASEAAAAMSKPLLNAGDGVGEHPSQALLDLYTIVDELSASSAASAAASVRTLTSELNGKVITMVGDLKNGRTVHSLAKLLSRFDVVLRYVSPESLRMPEEVIQQCSAGAHWTQHDRLTDDILQETDILYVTRVQKERFANLDEYNRVKDSFIISPTTLGKMKASARVMHPLPRVGEIDPCCDNDPRAAYFRQMRNGMYVRMALLRLILS